MGQFDTMDHTPVLNIFYHPSFEVVMIVRCLRQDLANRAIPMKPGTIEFLHMNEAQARRLVESYRSTLGNVVNFYLTHDMPAAEHTPTVSGVVAA